MSIAHRSESFHEELLHFCTGVLITENIVLTAAHCLDEELLSGIQFIVGSVDLRKGRKYGSIGWITYNQWADIKNITKTDDPHDIAMVKVIYIYRLLVGTTLTDTCSYALVMKILFCSCRME